MIAGIVTAVSALVTALGVSGVAAAYTVAAISTAIVAAGTSLIVYGVGTLISGGKLTGFATAVRNPIAPWNVQYGRSRVGGTVVFINEFGEDNKYLDLVIVISSHRCESVDEILFDNQKVPLSNIRLTTHGYAGTAVSLPTDTVVIQNPTDISRVGNVVTVVLHSDIPFLKEGDQVIIQKVHPVSGLFNGKFRVFNLTHVFPTSLTFSYLAGGPPFPPGTIDESGEVVTAWADYRSKIYMEVLDGTQALGETFQGMISGTPYDGDWGNLVTNPSNPWSATDNCSLVGKTAVFLRLHYNDEVFSNGLPQISFLIHGKNDIFDPRTSPPTYAYTENAALCIADYLSNKIWGYKADYGTAIPLAPLIAAANICDELVSLAEPSGETEPRYTCNGGFQLSLTRGEILRNLLTSCAGRLTYTGGQFAIWPAAWGGVSKSITGSTILSMMTAAFRWKTKASVTNLFNGVKGTYISPATNWQAADFPRYAQDAIHGYTWGTSPQFDQNLDDDGGDRRWLDVQLPFTISSATAQRIAKIELMRRRKGSGTFPLNLSGYQFRPMDVIEIDLAFFGWTGKQLEILDNRFKLDRQSDPGGAEAVLLGTEIDVQEVDSSDYFWDIGEELSAAGYQQAIVPDTRVPAPPTNFELSSDFDEIFATWTAPADGYVLSGGHIEVQYQLVASPEGLWLSLGRMDPSIVQAEIKNLTAGDRYHVRIRSVNAAGVPSPWVLGSPDPIEVVGFSDSLGEWAPYQVQANAADALYSGELSGSPPVAGVGEWTFELEQQYPLDPAGAAIPQAIVTGKLPVNRFIPGCGPPRIGGATQLDTGGEIPGGLTLYFQVCAVDALGRYSPPSNRISLDVPPGTDTNQVTLTGIVWPGLAGLVSYIVFVSDFQDLICGQATGSLISSPPDYAPSALIVNGPFERSTYAVGNPQIQRVRIKGKRLIHAGPIGLAVTELASPPDNTLTASAAIDPIASPPDSPPGARDDWAGRVLVMLGRPVGAAPYAAFNITAFDPDTGMFTLDRDPVTAGVQVGDAFAVCFLGYDNSANPYELLDGGLPNVSNGHMGEAPDDPNRIGNFVLVIKGKSRSMMAKIIGVTAQGYTLDQALPIDSSSIWIVVKAAWEYSSDLVFANADPLKATKIALDISNFAGLPMLIGGFTVDENGNESAESEAPIRMLFVWGAGQRINARATFDFEAPHVGDESNIYHVLVNCRPIGAYPSAGVPSITGNVLYQAKVSSDGGITWTDIFAADNLPLVPMNDMTGPKIDAFAQVGSPPDTIEFKVGDIIKGYIPSGSAEDSEAGSLLIECTSL